MQNSLYKYKQLYLASTHFISKEKFIKKIFFFWGRASTVGGKFIENKKNEYAKWGT